MVPRRRAAAGAGRPGPERKLIRVCGKRCRNAKGTVKACRCVCGGETHGVDRPKPPNPQLRLFEDNDECFISV